MPRRRVAAKRAILPDPKYGNQILAKFINHVMISGKKVRRRRHRLRRARIASASASKSDPIEVFEKALEAIAPYGRSEVAPRRWCDLSGSGRSASVASSGAGDALAGRQRARSRREIDGAASRRRNFRCSRRSRCCGEEA